MFVKELGSIESIHSNVVALFFSRVLNLLNVCHVLHTGCTLHTSSTFMLSCSDYTFIKLNENKIPVRDLAASKIVFISGAAAHC